jgi:hypothetical protein
MRHLRRTLVANIFGSDKINIYRQVSAAVLVFVQCPFVKAYHNGRLTWYTAHLSYVLANGDDGCNREVKI